MEPPPGPRPVPPPRKGSMERRPLSPLRRAGEYSGAGDALNGSRGSKPGTPERATVTQRVLIVMQSPAGPLSATETSQGPPSPESITTTSRGPSPRTTEGTPRSRAAGTPSHDQRAQETSEGTPRSRAAGTPSHDQRAQETSEGTPRSRAVGTPSHDQRGQETSEGTPRSRAAGTPSHDQRAQETSEGAPKSRAAVTPTLGTPSHRPQPGEPPLDTYKSSGGNGFQGHSQIQRENHRASVPEDPTTTGGLPLSCALTQEQNPPIESQEQGVPPPEEVGHVIALNWGSSPHLIGGLNCAAGPGRLPQGEGAEVVTPEGMWIQEDIVSRSVCGADITVTDGASHSVTSTFLPVTVCGYRKSPPTIGPEKVYSAPATGAEDIISTLAMRSEETKSTPTQRLEDTKSAPAVGSGDDKSALTITAVEDKSAPGLAAVEDKSTPAIAEVEDESAPAIAAVKDESAAAIGARDKSAAAIGARDKSAAAIGARDDKSTAAIGARDDKSTAAIGARDDKSTAAIGARDDKSSAAIGARDDKSAAAIGARDDKSTAAIGARDDKSTAAIGARDDKSAAAIGSGDDKSAAAIGSGDDKSASGLAAVEDKSALAIGAGNDKSAPAIGAGDDTKGILSVEEMKNVAAIRPEDVKSTLSVKMEDTQSNTMISNSVVVEVTQIRVNPAPQTSNLPAQSSLGRSSLSPVRITDPVSPQRNMSSKPPLPIPPRSNLYPGHIPREQETSSSHETASLSSFKSKAPAPDTLSYLDSVSLMSGTMESLTLLDDASSLGSDSEINGIPYRKTDKYGFLGGNQFSGNGETSVSVEIARQRELKWLEMFNNWDKWLTRRSQKVKLRCRKGIPSSLRAKAWQFLSSSHELLIKNPGKFEEMERQQGDPKWLDVIEKDLHRQFPFHEMFAARGGHGQQDLYRILKAYTVYRPEEGYCQAQAPVAAVLLMHMPAEQAFWCLVQICDKYLPGYYSAGLEAIQLDGEIFFALLRRVCPMAYRHLKKFKIDPILYMTEWFMCIFSRTLPWASVLRVWDMFFCEGVKIIFRVGLVLLRHTLGSVDKLRSCQGMYETMEKLRSLPVHCMQEDVLLPEVSSLPVTDALIERESNTQLRKWRENRGELQYRPSRRLHGARQIHEEKLRLNPTLSGSRLSLSSLRRPSPPTTPVLTLQPESVVVSEGLRPALPSPTSNKAPLGPPRETTKKGKDKQREQEKKREKEERERIRKREKEEREEREREREKRSEKEEREEREREKRREKEEREERRKEKEREKLKEKEEKRMQKEREKTEAKQKKERKFSFRRKESSPAADSPQNSRPGAADGAAAHDTYF
ncbi:uncharacterized protein [Engystomops pustulosus]|uniref:uncharacterized protein isoform X2 n=1 Tax=Engystomops pustulosus TaxID=76066 RepID=UPI003AFAD428